MRRFHLDVSDEEVLDWVKWRLSIFSDRELARVLETSPPMISKIRGQQMPLGAGILLKILELTGVRLSELSTLIKFTKSIDGRPQKICADQLQKTDGESYAKSSDHVY